MSYIEVAAGLALLLLSGEFLVRGAVTLSLRLGVSPLIVGLTIVAYGTSAPELLVCLDAHLSGQSGIAIGNVIGSNIANILLILGFAALIYPIGCTKEAVRNNGPIVIASAIILAALGMTGSISPLAGVLMMVVLVLFTIGSYQRERRKSRLEETDMVSEFDGGKRGLTVAVLFLLGGLIGVTLGSELLLDGAVELAREFGVSEATIGLTLVAVGTSLPELATAGVAAVRRHSEVALGNVLGSNIFNTFGIMGIVPLFGELPVSEKIAHYDLTVMVAITLGFGIWLAVTCRIGRLVGSLFLALYGLYVFSQFKGLEFLGLGGA